MADRLVQIVTTKRDFVKAKLDAGQIPTAPQLADFLRSLTAEIGGVVRFCPEDIVVILRQQYAAIGWDPKMNRATSSSPPAAQAVLRFLHDMVEAIQAYISKTHWEVTPAELNDISKAASKLWDLDTTRLAPGVDYAIDLQDGKKPYQTGDYADRPLFKFVHEDVFRREAWASFIELLDNYEAHTGQAEVVTAHERREEQRFINAIFQVPCMKYCHKYLVSKKLAPASEAAFKKMVHELWFTLYRRVVENDSSGFEHVFVGEEKDGKITGLHNWIQIFREEQAGRLDYLGYIRPRVRGSGAPREHEQLITVQFSWNGDVKDVSSSFIGTSPAFEVALYTLCFLAGEEHNTLQIGPYCAEITCYRMRHRGKTFIGTSFPSAISFTPDQGASKIQAVYRGNKTRNSSHGR